jgi:hypothetical protein
MPVLPVSDGCRFADQEMRAGNRVIAAHAGAGLS